MIPLPPDFSEFLKLLKEHEVRYLLIGGYAVGYHGYVRATADMDIWIEKDQKNASRMVNVLREFGFDVDGLKPDLFLQDEVVIRMGVPPIRIEIFNTISGVGFEECYAGRVIEEWDELEVHIIGLENLKENKQSSGRLKDLTDLEHLK